MKKLILLELCLLFLATTFQGDRLTGWVQQTIPRPDLAVRDLQFVDTLTGFLVQSRVNPDSSFISRTTDGGNNWTVTYIANTYLTSIHFISKLTGFCAGGEITTNDPGVVKKTTNGGDNWFTLSYVSGFIFLNDVVFVNNDTGWVCSTYPLDGGVWRTTNGGLSWQQQMDYTPSPSKVFFVNDTTGWVIGSANSTLYKTTNCGMNWLIQNSFNSIDDVFFITIDTGYIIGGSGNGLLKSTNGGNSWTECNSLPTYPSARIYFVNGQHGWVGNRPNHILVTADGYNWGTQYSPIYSNYFISFVDTLHGWAGSSGLVHTTDGGGPITYTGIKRNGDFVPSFELGQNYPNPFNASTRLNFSIFKPCYVDLIIYNITGKEIARVISGKRYDNGDYSLYFDAGKYSITSGVYFYLMKGATTDNREIFLDTKKMLLIK